jgi:hypothetical protein
MIIMKKYLIGAIVGFMLSLGVGAHAEVISMIGKVIDGSFPIKINGNTLQNPAITIEGVSYVPTREFAESLGAQVKFNADLGIEVAPSSTPVPTTSPQPSEDPKKIRYNEIRVEMLKLIPEIQDLQDKINKTTFKNPDGTYPVVENLDTYKKELADKQAQLDALTQEKHNLEKELNPQQ